MKCLQLQSGPAATITIRLPSTQFLCSLFSLSRTFVIRFVRALLRYIRFNLVEDFQIDKQGELVLFVSLAEWTNWQDVGNVCSVLR